VRSDWDGCDSTRAVRLGAGVWAEPGAEQDTRLRPAGRVRSDRGVAARCERDRWYAQSEVCLGTQRPERPGAPALLSATCKTTIPIASESDSGALRRRSAAARPRETGRKHAVAPGSV